MQRILYIDDEKDLLEIAASFFSEEGITIDTASNILQALGLARSIEYQLIIADLQLADGSGVQLVEQLRQEGKFKGNLVVVTGEMSWQASRPEDLVVFKPIMFEDLVTKVKQLLARKLK
jgi:DNA-binding response OmpR family regulator